MTDIEPRKPAPTNAAAIKSKVAPWLPSFKQVATVAIVCLTISNVGLFVLLKRAETPEMLTVGVREMTQTYMASVVLEDIAPEEAAAKVETFLAVTQDTLDRAGRNKNVLLFARECVLAGQIPDITKDVEAAVQASMARHSKVSRPAVTIPKPAQSAPSGLGFPEAP